MVIGRTLVEGREPLITRLAREVHGSLAPFMEAYTRRVTVAWCVFCAAQLGMSAALLIFASLEKWSLFVNILNAPLVVLMFVGEYIYRVMRFPDYPHCIYRAGHARVRQGCGSVRRRDALRGHMTSLPLLRGYEDGAVFARRKGTTIRTDEFLHNVAKLAELLPERKYILNLCTDRYRFAVGFAAALLRQQTSLLPPNLTSGLCSDCCAYYPDAYCLVDDDGAPDGLLSVRYPALDVKPVLDFDVPVIPGEHVAAIVFTSGSTGEPVSHPKFWRSLVASAQAEIERLGIAAHTGITGFGTVPAQHMYGLESTGDHAHAGRAACCTRAVRSTRRRLHGA
jgi:hypothetical protein